MKFKIARFYQNCAIGKLTFKKNARGEWMIFLPYRSIGGGGKELNTSTSLYQVSHILKKFVHVIVIY